MQHKSDCDRLRVLAFLQLSQPAPEHLLDAVIHVELLEQKLQ